MRPSARSAAVAAAKAGAGSAEAHLAAVLQEMYGAEAARPSINHGLSEGITAEQLLALLERSPAEREIPVVDVAIQWVTRKDREALRRDHAAWTARHNELRQAMQWLNAGAVESAVHVLLPRGVKVAVMYESGEAVSALSGCRGRGATVALALAAAAIRTRAEGL